MPYEFAEYEFELEPEASSGALRRPAKQAYGHRRSCPSRSSRAPAGTYPCRASLLIPSHPWRPASIGPRLRGFVPALRPTL